MDNMDKSVYKKGLFQHSSETALLYFYGSGRLYQLRVHGDAGVEQFGDGAISARIFRELGEFCGIQAGHAGGYFQVDVGDRAILESNDGFGIDAAGGEASAGDDEAELHAEATGMRRGDQLFRIGAGAIFEPAAEGILCII